VAVGPGYRKEKMNEDIVFETCEEIEKPDPGGVYSLWVRVTLNAVNSFLHGRIPSKTSEAFLFDEGNAFFNSVAEGMGFDPNRLRQAILKAAKRGEHRNIKMQ